MSEEEEIAIAEKVASRLRGDQLMANAGVIDTIAREQDGSITIEIDGHFDGGYVGAMAIIKDGSYGAVTSRWIDFNGNKIRISPLDGKQNLHSAEVGDTVVFYAYAIQEI